MFFVLFLLGVLFVSCCCFCCVFVVVGVCLFVCFSPCFRIIMASLYKQIKEHRSANRLKNIDQPSDGKLPTRLELFFCGHTTSFASPLQKPLWKLKGCRVQTAPCPCCALRDRCLPGACTIIQYPSPDWLLSGGQPPRPYPLLRADFGNSSGGAQLAVMAATSARAAKL